MIALDVDLRLLHVHEVGAADAASLEERVPLVHRALHDCDTEAIYFAVAQLDTQFTGNFHPEFERQDELFRSCAELAEHEFLGICLSNGKEFYSSVPQYGFMSYSSLDHLPRTAFYPGPHSADCDCGAGAQLDQRLRHELGHH